MIKIMARMFPVTTVGEEADKEDNNMESNNNQKKVIIVGGGLVGALNACFLSARGYKVDVFERRPDIRQEEFVRGRSINLALSCRGREALRTVGLEDHIVGNGIPMYARMIHDLDGTRRPIPYGKKDQYIMSVDRRKLNELMLTAAEKNPEVNMFFEHKFVNANFEKTTATFKKSDGSDLVVEGDLIIGCDGAHSGVRNQLTKTTLLDYSQEYIPHGYIELAMPAVNKQFCMETNYLHIWPRNEYMMIGLPNTEDSSFVITLFMPFKIFEQIKTEEQVMQFFETNFPDAISLIGRENLLSDFMSSKPLPLVSVKCSPHNLNSNVVLMGDAAHAMVPFYGQGMNCGFEDCLVLNELLDKYKDNWEKCLAEYSSKRTADAHSMCDLALYNYIEMRSSVNSRVFLLRKKLDNFLHWMMPNTWVPLYTMVSFTRTRYSQCVERRRWQDQVIKRLLTVAMVTSVGLGATVVYKMSTSNSVHLQSALQHINNIWATIKN